MNSKSICVLGGTGFVGRHLATRLANRGYRIKVLTRHPQRHRDIEVLPGARLVEADIHDPTVLQAQFAGCDAVINLVGILHEYPGQTFAAVHAELPGKVVDACRAAGIKRLLHMSALRADAAQGPSQYLFTKGAGERKVMESRDLAVTCFKPSIVFAPNDNFLNQFANMLKGVPVLPLACPNARFAPVYVGDVAAAFEKALEDDATIGQCYELCGPRVYTFKELVEDIARMLGLKRRVVGLPDGLARLQAKILGMLPVKLFTMDNYLSLQVDSVCACNGLEALGITPRSVEGIMAPYFGNQRQRQRYDALRQTAGRD
ncbi:MAG: complex I NDUFA9 subunit family protein [Candidatus Contendobacter sp.]|nr:complex I NDUFA9 subunit family protein [Candidatus Contendobacter sp.]MDG4559379.1 complex I NDUFA9 subunit family protein [Candidatus Contendobacter sp.]